MSTISSRPRRLIILAANLSQPQPSLNLKLNQSAASSKPLHHRPLTSQASLNNLIAFGLLTGFSILMAFVADITITPALLTLVSPATAPAAPSGVDAAEVLR
jgi:hypothetical protein